MLWVRCLIPVCAGHVCHLTAPCDVRSARITGLDKSTQPHSSAQKCGRHSSTARHTHSGRQERGERGGGGIRIRIRLTVRYWEREGGGGRGGGRGREGERGGEREGEGGRGREREREREKEGERGREREEGRGREGERGGREKTKKWTEEHTVRPQQGHRQSR